MSNPFKPDVPSTNAKAPPLKEIKAPEKQLASSKDDKLTRRRNGKKALRIDLQIGGVPRTRTGLNVPMG